LSTDYLPIYLLGAIT